MKITVEAVYEAGNLRLLAPLDLPEGCRVQVTISRIGSIDNEIVDGQKRSLHEIAMQIAAMPNEGLDDGFSGADHDRVLYGKNGAR